jgi:oligoendopeptidase F
MNEVWNLEPIYKGFDDPAYEADMSALKEKVNEITAFAQQLSTVEPIQGLRDGVALQEAFSELVGKLAGYASLRQAADTRDPNAGSCMGRVMSLYSNVAAPVAAF